MLSLRISTKLANLTLHDCAYFYPDGSDCWGRVEPRLDMYDLHTRKLIGHVHACQGHQFEPEGGPYVKQEV